jgi:hypothetical protein
MSRTSQKTSSKVLVAVPYHPAKRYCLPQCMEALHALTYPNKEILMRFDPNAQFAKKDNVKQQREFFRRQVLDWDFDALFFMGCDTVPPPDVIERLLAHDKAIVSGVYDLRRGGDPSAVAWMEGVEPDRKDRILHDEGAGLVQVTGTGLDCILISRGALEQCGWMDWDVNDDDWPWCKEMEKLGIPIFVDTSIQCQHWHDEGSFSKHGKYNILYTAG